MELLRRIERHMRRSGMPPTRLGRAAVNDPNLVRDLRAGREPGAALTARVMAWLDRRERELRRGGRP